SLAPMKVTAAPPPRSAATTVRACIQVPLVGLTTGIRAVARQNAPRSPACRAFGASPISPWSLGCSRRQLLEESLGLLQIERVETFGEPAVDRSKKLASPPSRALIR